MRQLGAPRHVHRLSPSVYFESSVDACETNAFKIYPCEDGHFLSADRASGDVSCGPCPAGRSRPHLVIPECLSCVEGRYTLLAGEAEREPCLEHGSLFHPICSLHFHTSRTATQHTTTRHAAAQHTITTPSPHHHHTITTPSPRTETHRNTQRHTETPTETHRDTYRDAPTETHPQRHTHRDTPTETDPQRHTHRDTPTETDTQRQTHTDRHTQTDTHRQTHTDTDTQTREDTRRRNTMARIALGICHTILKNQLDPSDTVARKYKRTRTKRRTTGQRGKAAEAP